MVDVATLNMNVKSDSARKAKQDLDNLEKAAGRLGASMIRATKQAETGVQGLINKTMGLDRESKSAKASATTFAAAIEKESAAFRKLQGAIDPVTAAKQRFEAQVEQINRAQRQGIITQEEYNRTLLSSKMAYDAAIVSANRMSMALQQSSRGTNRMASAATQAGFQVQDFAIQVAAGTSPILALNQQLPQLLGAFGSFGKIALYGSILGTVAAVAIAVVPKFLAMRDSVQQAEDALKALIDMTDDYSSASAEALASLEDLTEEYGTLAAAAQKFLNVRREISGTNAQRAADAQVNALTQVLESLQGATSIDFQDAINGQIKLAELNSQLFELDQKRRAALLKGDQEALDAIDEQQDALDARLAALKDTEDVIGSISREYGIQRQEAIQLIAAFKQLQEADGVREQALAVEDIVDFLKQAKAEGAQFTADGETLYRVLVEAGTAMAKVAAESERLSDGTRKAVEAAEDMLNELKDAEAEAERFTDELMAAFRAGEDISNLQLDAGILPAVDAAVMLAEQLGISLGLAQQIARQSAMSEGQKRTAAMVRAGMVPPEALADVGLTPSGEIDPTGEEITGSPSSYYYRPDKPKKTRSGGGRGGKSEEEKAFEEMMKRREEIINRAKSNQQLYNEAVAELDTIQQTLGLTTEQYNNELDVLAQKYLDAGGAAEFFASQQKLLQDGFIDMIVSGKDFSQVLLQVAQNIAKAALQAALFGTGPMANLFGQKPGTGILSSIFKFATGTNNAPGGLAIVGEQGKELVNLPKGSEVIPTPQTNRILEGMGGNTTNVSVVPKIVNVLDPSLVGDFINTPQGEELILNVVNRNRGADM